MKHFETNSNPPPFWRQFGFFFRYLKQEKLYYQITLLAFANILLFIPSLIIYILVWSMLFLTSYKLAFEVLHTVSMGQFEFGDLKTYEIDDKIGFKAMSMGVIQLLIFFFVLRNDPATGIALLLLTLIATPAFLMMLCKTQSVLASLNPLNLITVISRIGLHYLWLLVFFILCAVINLLLARYLNQLIPSFIGDIFTAWVLYFFLVFTFLVIGYVMYYKADELGYDTIDTEVIETIKEQPNDPIKERIIYLIENKKPKEAIAVIEDLKAEEQRTDLDAYLSKAKQQLIEHNRQRPADQLQLMVDAKQYKAAIEMMLTYLEDGHFIKPKNVNTLSQLIHYAFETNQFGVVIKLCRDIDKRYPLEHQAIVDNYFLVAKIYYQQKKTEQAEKLLQALVNKYNTFAKTQSVSSYLKGIKKLKDNHK